MKYSLANYAQALAAAVSETGASDADRIAANFAELLDRSGDAVHGEKIVAEAARRLRRKGGRRDVTIESARKLSSPQEKLVSELVRPGDDVAWRINPALVAGVRVLVDGELEFDGSLKRKLDKMFKSA